MKPANAPAVVPAAARVATACPHASCVLALPLAPAAAAAARAGGACWHHSLPPAEAGIAKHVAFSQRTHTWSQSRTPDRMPACCRPTSSPCRESGCQVWAACLLQTHASAAPQKNTQKQQQCVCGHRRSGQLEGAGGVRRETAVPTCTRYLTQLTGLTHSAALMQRGSASS